MIPHFTNTTAFWALLAIPLITAIHFLQHKTKTQATAATSSRVILSIKWVRI